MNNHFSLQRLHDMYVHKRVFYNFRCNTTFEQQMLGLLYVLFLVTMVVVLSFKAKGVRENYREAMYIGLTMGFTVCIFLVWILGGFIAPREYQVKTIIKENKYLETTYQRAFQRKIVVLRYEFVFFKKNCKEEFQNRPLISI